MERFCLDREPFVECFQERLGSSINKRLTGQDIPERIVPLDRLHLGRMVRITTHTENRRHDLAADLYIVDIVKGALERTSVSWSPSNLHRRQGGGTNFFEVSFHVVDSLLEFRIAQRDEVWAKAGFIFSTHIHGH